MEPIIKLLYRIIIYNIIISGNHLITIMCMSTLPIQLKLVEIIIRKTCIIFILSYLL